MPDARTDQTWGTSQLVEFLAVLSGQLDEGVAMRAAVERVLESLDAEIGVLLDGDGLPSVVVGLRADDKRLFQLIAAGLDDGAGPHLDGFGECRTACAALAAGENSYRLLVARLGDEDFIAEGIVAATRNGVGARSDPTTVRGTRRTQRNASGCSSSFPGCSETSPPGCRCRKYLTPLHRAR
jgi:hypothetical protein